LSQAKNESDRIQEKKAFADMMEERIETDPTLRQLFDAAVKYVQHGAAPISTSMLMHIRN
jgi:hypothetical protein